MAAREGQAPSLQMHKLPMQSSDRAVTFIHLVIPMAPFLYKCIDFESPSEPSHVRQQISEALKKISPNSQLLHLLCALIFFPKKAVLEPQWSQYGQHLWDWKLPCCFLRSAVIFAAGYVAEVATQATETFPGKEI